MKSILKCAIYTRVSTDNQAEVEFNSCEAQESKIQSFVKSQENMEVLEVFSDAGFTGANLNRPGLADMLEVVKSGHINLIIAYKIDRLTRSPKDFYQLIELFDQHEVDFISVTERFDTSTPSGRLLRNIMLTFAQFERELASERTRDKMIERANKGMWNGGHLPFGYRVENKKLVPYKSEAEVIRLIFDNYVSNGSLAKVMTELKRMKVRNRKGGQFSKSTIATMLRNKIYIGKCRYGNREYNGIHEPLVSNEVFNLAQESHQEKNRILRLYKDYPLAGLILCAECGSLMTPCHTNKRKKGKLTRYYYYRCTCTFKKDWKQCQTRQVNANRLEDMIFKNLERISSDTHYLENLFFRIEHDAVSSNSPGFSASSGIQHGLEPKASCSDKVKFSAQIFGNILHEFVKIAPQKKGIEKNLWSKKFIEKIVYSKKEIALTLFYQSVCTSHTSAVRPENISSKNRHNLHTKKAPNQQKVSSELSIRLPERNKRPNHFGLLWILRLD